MSEQRQHIPFSYFKTPSVGPANRSEVWYPTKRTNQSALRWTSKRDFDLNHSTAMHSFHAFLTQVLHVHDDAGAPTRLHVIRFRDWNRYLIPLKMTQAFQLLVFRHAMSQAYVRYFLYTYRYICTPTELFNFIREKCSTSLR